MLNVLNGLKYICFFFIHIIIHKENLNNLINGISYPGITYCILIIIMEN